jgi:hypothetical protein
MTSPHQPSKGRARVMWADDDGTINDTSCNSRPVLVIPCPSLKSARARKKALDRTLEEQIELGAKAIYELSYSAKNEPRFLKELRGSCRPVPTWEQLVTESPENVVAINCRAKARAVLAVTEGRG